MILWMTGIMPGTILRDKELEWLTEQIRFVKICARPTEQPVGLPTAGRQKNPGAKSPVRVA
jgi:hypothetical protein